MRASHPSKGTPLGSRDDWWRHFRLKGPNRVVIGQFSVGHACIPPFQRNPFGVTWRLMTSHLVAKLLPVMRNGTFCITTIVRKKRGNRWRMRTRSFPVMWLPVPVTWLPVTSFLVRVASGDVTSGSSASLLLKCDFGSPYILLCLVFSANFSSIWAISWREQFYKLISIN